MPRSSATHIVACYVGYSKTFVIRRTYSSYGDGCFAAADPKQPPKQPPSLSETVLTLSLSSVNGY